MIEQLTNQPLYPAPIDWGNALTRGLKAAFVFDNQGSLIERVTGAAYPVTNAVTRTDRLGTVLHFDGSGDYVDLGTQTVNGVSLFADSASQWSVVIYARLESSGGTGTFLGKAGASGASRTFQSYCDGGAAHFPGFWVRGAQTIPDWAWSTADWHQYTVTWDGSTAKAYGDCDKENILAVGAAAQEAENIVFGARTGGSGGLLTGRLAYAVFFDNAISREAHLKIYQNFWQIFEPESDEIWVPVSGGAAALEGNAQAVATASGNLTTQIKLSGASLSIATATGSLTTQIPLAGSTVAIAQADGALSTQVTLGGNAVAEAGAAGALATAIPLLGPAAGTAAATGALATQVRLAGFAQAQVTASADLTAGGALAGAATVSSTASGVLTAQIKLDGAAVAAAIAAAGLSTQINLAGNASASAAVVATLTTSIQLGGDALATSGASGTLVTAIPLTAAALAVVIATGELTVPILLAGSASAVASASGQLSGLNPEYNPRYAVHAVARNFSTSHTKQYVTRYQESLQ